MGQSRVEDILEATIEAEPYTEEPQSRVEELLIELKQVIEQGGGGGGTTVIPNPSGEATDDLEKVKIGSTIYSIPEGGTDVEANPTGTATDELDSIRIGNDIFSIPSGGAEIEYYDYAYFSGKGSIVLPFNLNADYKITVTFDIPVYSDDNAIIGNSASNNYLHISQYASRYYTSTGTSETYFEDTLLGKHTYVINDDGTNKLDGVVKTSYTPTTNNGIALVVGGRDLSRPGLNLRGKIYEYIIESISTGEELMHLLPIKLKAAGVIIKSGLYDSVSGEVYTTTGVTLGND